MSAESTRARDLVEALRGAGWTGDLRLQQTLCVFEEAGEFDGAARRYLGMARRSGLLSDVRTELADVVITCYVTAQVFKVDLDEIVEDAYPFNEIMQERVGFGGWSAARQTLKVARAAGRFVDAAEQDLNGVPRRSGVRLTLAEVVVEAYVAACFFGFDLDDAITDKLKVIFSRGWREGEPAR